MFDIEHRTGDALRAWANAEALYSDRHQAQRWATAAFVIIGAALAAGAYIWWRRDATMRHKIRGRDYRYLLPMMAAAFTCALVGFTGLRLVSLHALDQLIYGGGGLGSTTCSMPA